ncbi:MAG TPA: inositol monophosphatase family protein, partial [Gemmatimonadaceae bacterium]
QNCIKAPDHFFKENDNSLRVILDGIDGTASFMRGIPLFCTAVAILVGNQVRVSAVYDPIHHVVYSGALEGKYDHPEARVWAEAWNVATGNRLRLPRPLTQGNGHKPTLREEAVGIHFTRSNHERLKEVLRPHANHKDASSTIERIARSCAGVYALNSGVLAMAEVAGGGLGAFVNNVTNLWDVAAGEVLVRACGGKVTEFSGAPIDYSVDKKISVVAAKQPLHPSVLSIINDDR